jgi:hypothetical protein
MRGGRAGWTGQVSLPDNRAPNQFRMVIKEFEHLLDDSRFVRKVRVVIDASETPDGEPRIVFEDRTFLPGAGRLAFAETIVV